MYAFCRSCGSKDDEIHNFLSTFKDNDCFVRLKNKLLSETVETPILKSHIQILGTMPWDLMIVIYPTWFLVSEFW